MQILDSLMRLKLFYLDNLSMIMISLICFVGLSVSSFSWRYLTGDLQKRNFFFKLIGLVFFTCVLVCADHLLLALLSLAASNLLLTRLMLHKKNWQAARHSALFATKNFGVGLIFLGLGFYILYLITNETSIQAIINSQISSSFTIVSCMLIILAAMCQSALWPFHKWLLSSLNSPTPVSAIMHAGIINGGGYLLARFAPLLTEQPFMLNLIFIMGITTALLGTLWKLLQSDVKRMLACSTMGQMGFMLAQCGLGLFAAAIAHLCWHGLFKAYLFLASGSSFQEKKLTFNHPPCFKEFGFALMCGLSGTYMFCYFHDKNIITSDTTLFLVILAQIAATQFSLEIIRSIKNNLSIKLPAIIIATMILGSLYGLSVNLIEQLLIPVAIFNPQKINAIHILGLITLISSWLFMIFVRAKIFNNYPSWALKLYVKTLNASQPAPKTVTTHRNQYQF